MACPFTQSFHAGLHLSLLVLEVNGTGVPLHTSTGSKEDSARLDHLSVHTGSIVRSVPVPQLLENCSDVDWADFISEDRWWRLDWTLHEEDWPKPMVHINFCVIAQMLIDPKERVRLDACRSTSKGHPSRTSQTCTVGGKPYPRVS